MSDAAARPVRIPPLPEEEWDDEIVDLLAHSWVAAKKTSEVKATFVRHKELFAAWDPFGGQLFAGELRGRDREVLVLRVAWRTQSAPEWAYHEPLARSLGLTDADLQHVIGGAPSPTISAHESVLLDAVDELMEMSTISDRTWGALAGELTEKQLLEVPIVVGHYLMVAFFTNVCGTPLWPGRVPLPPRP